MNPHPHNFFFSQQRLVKLNFEFDLKKADQVVELIERFNTASTTDPIFFYFNTEGGGVRAGIRIFHAIENSRAPTVGIVDQAGSIGAIVLQACGRRVGLPGSKIQFHYPRPRSPNPPPKHKRQMGELADRLIEIVVERSGLPEEKVRELFNRSQSNWISPKEAKILNLIDATPP